MAIGDPQALVDVLGVAEYQFRVGAPLIALPFVRPAPLSHVRLEGVAVAAPHQPLRRVPAPQAGQAELQALPRSGLAGAGMAGVLPVTEHFGRRRIVRVVQPTLILLALEPADGPLEAAAVSLQVRYVEQVLLEVGVDGSAVRADPARIVRVEVGSLGHRQNSRPSS